MLTRSPHEEEQRFRKDVWAFGVSVKDHWKELVGGSLIATVVSVAAGMGWNLPPAIVALCAFAMVVPLACFLGYRDQRAKVLALERAVNDSQKRKESLLRLQQLSETGNDLVKRCRIVSGEVPSAQERTNWINEVILELCILDQELVYRFKLAEGVPEVEVPRVIKDWIPQRHEAIVHIWPYVYRLREIVLSLDAIGMSKRGVFS